jgi:hypothetical protein
MQRRDAHRSARSLVTQRIPISPRLSPFLSSEPPSIFGGSYTVHVPYHAIHSPFVPDAVLWAQIRIPLCISHLLLPPHVGEPTIHPMYLHPPWAAPSVSTSHLAHAQAPLIRTREKKTQTPAASVVQHNGSRELRFQLICKLCPMTNRCQVEQAVAEHGCVYRV